MTVRLFIAAAAVTAVFAPVAIAGPIITLAGVKWPDLVVADLQVSQAKPGLTQAVFDTVSFTVKEACGAKVAKAYHVALKIAASQSGAPLYTVTLAANPLPANGSQTWSLPLGKSFASSSYVRVDADSNNEIGEDVEGNNYAQLNPNVAPFPQNSKTYCKPHAIGVVKPQP